MNPINNANLTYVTVWNNEEIGWETDELSALPPYTPVWLNSLEGSIISIVGRIRAWHPVELLPGEYGWAVVSPDGVIEPGQLGEQTYAWTWDPIVAKWRFSQGRFDVLLKMHRADLAKQFDVVFLRSETAKLFEQEVGLTNQMRYYHHDHLRSATLMTDFSGEVVEMKEYTPYGGVRRQMNFLQIVEEYGFTQKEMDQESTLNHFGSRYLATNAGRFISTDPALNRIHGVTADRMHLSNPQVLNSYSYVSNRPLIFDDPDGEFAHLVVGGLVGAATEILVHVVVEGKSVSSVDPGKVAIAAAVGAVTGGGAALAAARTVGRSMLTKAAAQGAIGAASGAVESVGMQAYESGHVDSTKVFASSIGGASGAFGGTLAGDLTENLTRAVIVKRASDSVRAAGGDPLGARGAGVVKRIEQDFSETSTLAGNVGDSLTGTSAALIGAKLENSRSTEN